MLCWTIRGSSVGGVTLERLPQATLHWHPAITFYFRLCQLSELSLVGCQLDSECGEILETTMTRNRGIARLHLKGNTRWFPLPCSVTSVAEPQQTCALTMHAFSVKFSTEFQRRSATA